MTRDIRPARSFEAFARASRVRGSRLRVTAAAVALWAAPVAGAPPPQPVAPFDVLGFLQAATLGGVDDLAGGTLTVNGHTIAVPRNTIVAMPAASLTWAE